MTDAAPRALPRGSVPALAICAYLAIACLAYWPVEPLSRSHLSYCACSDSVRCARRGHG